MLTKDEHNTQATISRTMISKKIPVKLKVAVNSDTHVQHVQMV